MELLKNGLVDVSVINTPADLQIPGIKMEVIKPLQDRFICGNQYPELIERPVTLKELERYPFLMLEKNTMTRKFFDRFIQECDVHITPEIELGSMDLLVELVCINLGISFVLNDCLHHYLDRGKIHVINIRETIPTRYLAVISPAQIPVSIAARKFIQHLSEPPSSAS
jgi:DNA-binding transcriptional LysR family regulator